METVIYDLAHAIDFVLDEGHDPGTGVCYHNGYFEMHGFWQHADNDCTCPGDYNLGEHDEDCPSDPWLFHHYDTGFKARWYKRIGRSYEDNGVHIKTLDKYRIAVALLESVRSDPNPEWSCTLRSRG